MHHRLDGVSMQRRPRDERPVMPQVVHPAGIALSTQQVHRHWAGPEVRCGHETGGRAATLLDYLRANVPLNNLRLAMEVGLKGGTYPRRPDALITEPKPRCPVWYRTLIAKGVQCPGSPNRRELEGFVVGVSGCVQVI
jgi:hypothetical protein